MYNEAKSDSHEGNSGDHTSDANPILAENAAYCDVQENKMKENEQQANLSRRDFVKTAAVGLGGMSAVAAAGVGAQPTEAAQTSDRLPPAAQGVGAIDKLVITLAPSGRAPDLPSQPDMRVPKLHADAALEGFNAGASIVHLRGTQLAGGQGGPDLENWREVTGLVRSRCDMVINYGSSAMAPSIRKPLLALKPDAGSVLVGHHYGGMPISAENARQSMRDHLEAGVLPEVEIFHSGDIANLNVLVKAGLVRPPYQVTLFFNYSSYYGVPPSLLELQSRLALLPPNTHWTVNTKGPRQLEMAAYAILWGGHVRTGLENSVEAAPGRPATSQGECVEQIVRLARDLGREVATPQDARKMLGLPRKPEKPNV